MCSQALHSELLLLSLVHRPRNNHIPTITAPLRSTHPLLTIWRWWRYSTIQYPSLPDQIAHVSKVLCTLHLPTKWDTVSFIPATTSTVSQQQSTSMIYSFHLFLPKKWQGENDMTKGEAFNSTSFLQNDAVLLHTVTVRCGFCGQYEFNCEINLWHLTYWHHKYYYPEYAGASWKDTVSKVVCY